MLWVTKLVFEKQASIVQFCDIQNVITNWMKFEKCFNTDSFEFNWNYLKRRHVNNPFPILNQFEKEICIAFLSLFT